MFVRRRGVWFGPILSKLGYVLLGEIQKTKNLFFLATTTVMLR